MNSLSRRDKRAFTLVEMLVVIAIIALVAAMVLGVSSYARAKAYKAKTLAGIEKLRNGLEEFRLNAGAYPSFYTIGQGTPTNWNILTNYIKELKVPDDFQDAYGRGFQYTNGPAAYQYRIWSLGPDGIASADDIDPSAGNQ